jgi:hypothetical protein
MVFCTMLEVKWWCVQWCSTQLDIWSPAIKLLHSQSQSTISPFCTVTPQKYILKRLGPFWECTTVESTKFNAVSSYGRVL